MTYPNSSNVSAGQPTASAHYNHLRSDALFLGKDESNAVTLGKVLSRYEENLKLELLETNRVRVPASLEQPVNLMVSGYMLQATANVDLSSGAAPAGAAAVYYVFAIRSGGSTTFTIDVNTSAAESTDRRLIGSFYWGGSAIVAKSIRTQKADWVKTILNYNRQNICQGRLCLVSGSPAYAGEVASASTVYFSPYKGNLVSLYDPVNGWTERAFSELSISLSGVAAGKNVDIFLYDNAGSLVLEKVQWTNDTTRATSLSDLDGRKVKAGTYTHLYLGTVRTVSSGATCDMEVRRFVWNYYNRLEKAMKFIINTASSWSYNLAAWRPINADTSQRLGVLVGVAEDNVQVNLTGFGRNSSYWHTWGIDYDGAGGNDADVTIATREPVGGHAVAKWNGIVEEGYHYFQIMEHCEGGTCFGYAGNYYGNPGLTGCLKC